MRKIYIFFENSIICLCLFFQLLILCRVINKEYIYYKGINSIFFFLFLKISFSIVRLVNKEFKNYEWKINQTFIDFFYFFLDAVIIIVISKIFFSLDSKFIIDKFLNSDGSFEISYSSVSIIVFIAYNIIHILFSMYIVLIKRVRKFVLLSLYLFYIRFVVIVILLLNYRFY